MSRSSRQRLALLTFAGLLPFAGAVAAQSTTSEVAGERRIGDLLDASGGVPIEVRRVATSPGGLAATLVNASSRPIVAYEVVLASRGEDGRRRLHAVVSGHGLQWQPGVEIVVMLQSQPVHDGAHVVPTAAILDDGAGFGDAEVIERFSREWRARYAGLTGVLAVLAEGPTPTIEEDLQGLIDRVAMAMARVPGDPRGTGLVEQPYVETVTALKRLQGRGMVGTDRFDRELQGIRSRLQREIDERRKTPALLDAIR